MRNTHTVKSVSQARHASCHLCQPSECCRPAHLLSSNGPGPRRDPRQGGCNLEAINCVVLREAKPTHPQCSLQGLAIRKWIHASTSVRDSRVHMHTHTTRTWGCDPRGGHQLLPLKLESSIYLFLALRVESDNLLNRGWVSLAILLSGHSAAASRVGIQLGSGMTGPVERFQLWNISFGAAIKKFIAVLAHRLLADEADTRAGNHAFSNHNPRASAPLFSWQRHARRGGWVRRGCRHCQQWVRAERGHGHRYKLERCRRRDRHRRELERLEHWRHERMVHRWNHGCREPRW